VIIEEAELYSRCGIGGGKGVDLAYKNLEKLELVLRQVDDDHRVYYTVHPQRIMMNTICVDCDLARRKSLRINKKAFHYFDCTSELNCVGNYFRIAQALLKKKKAMHGLQKATDFRVTRKKVENLDNEFVEKDVDVWILKDFTSYTMHMYRKHYPNIEYPARTSIQRNLSSIKKFIVTERDDWGFVLKQYIDHTFKESVENNRGTSTKWMKNQKNIRDFLGTKAVNKIEACELYEMRCAYWVDGRCEIVATKGKCTKKIRKIMRRKYN
jgi:hypothetical protein